MGRLGAGAARRSVEVQQMSPAERRFVGQSAEERQADAHAEEWLGGIHPEGRREDEEPHP